MNAFRGIPSLFGRVLGNQLEKRVNFSNLIFALTDVSLRRQEPRE